ncbi:hypothetical protein [Gordonia liuliyuniae]|uniref:hypothetical protein n=1 Tax=Gordonia liuliyuniae TaxID=2911517 RepID=UPI001F3E53E9|nr:hypothetical protein [Gordonia liuliyuniae]
MTTTGNTSATRSTASANQPKHSQATQAQPLAAAANEPAHPATDSGRSVSVWTMLLFIAGCALLVIAAINLPNLGQWGDEHGNVLVFLCFFLVMSIGGRWFWAGIDALWSAIRHKGN